MISKERLASDILVRGSFKFQNLVNLEYERSRDELIDDKISIVHLKRRPEKSELMTTCFRP